MIAVWKLLIFSFGFSSAAAVIDETYLCFSSSFVCFETTEVPGALLKEPINGKPTRRFQIERSIDVSQLLIDGQTMVVEGAFVEDLVLDRSKIKPDIRWVENGSWIIEEDGLTANKIPGGADDGNIRASFPLNLVHPGAESLFYYEVEVKKYSCSMSIGMSGPELPMRPSVPYEQTVGVYNNSFAIEMNGGHFKVSGKKADQMYAPRRGRYAGGIGFRKGVTIGCGLLISPNGKHHIFFTRNGTLFAKPIVLESKVGISGTLAPAVSGSACYHASLPEEIIISVKANFGGKPFRSNLTHIKSLVLLADEYKQSCECSPPPPLEGKFIETPLKHPTSKCEYYDGEKGRWRKPYICRRGDRIRMNDKYEINVGVLLECLEHNDTKIWGWWSASYGIIEKVKNMDCIHTV